MPNTQIGLIVSSIAMIMIAASPTMNFKMKVLLVGINVIAIAADLALVNGF